MGSVETEESASSVFELGRDHEQVVFCNDPASGLRAIVSIYSTALGPGLGGARFYPYQTESQALIDVLNLSRGMAYKAALAGLDLGGGKAVIIGDPLRDKTEQLLRAYGRFVQSLNGRYFTACDVGTYSEDMDVIARECEYVTGRTVENGGAGDSSVLTALGVFQGMRAACETAWGSDSLQGKRVGIAGVGKVGRHLVRHLLEEGADVVVADVSRSAVEKILAEHPYVETLDSANELIQADLDIYAPCAMGNAVDEDNVHFIKARVVCGAANNQLAHSRLGDVLASRGVLYAPDYCVNAGGLIQVADELAGFSFERAKTKAQAIYDTTKAVFAAASAARVTPERAADQMAEDRMREVGRLREIWLG
jgi:valine dehydrogenase (NAD+)